MTSHTEQTQVSNRKTLIKTLLSGWSFFFRWPAIQIQTFDHNGIVFGSWLQAGIFSLVYFSLHCLFIKDIFHAFHTLLALAILALLTGWMHEDGLADIADSMSVFASKNVDDLTTKEKIHAIVRDSRVGVFGVNALLFLWGTRAFAALSVELPVNSMVGIILVSRALPIAHSVLLAHKGHTAGHKLTPYLAQVSQGMNFFSFISAIATAFFLLLISNTFLVVSITISTTMTVGWAFFEFQKRRMGGIFGDAIGATICFIEISIIIVLSHATLLSR